MVSAWDCHIGIEKLIMAGLYCQIPYSGLFPWGANFRYFRGSPGCREIFHPRKFSTHCVALSTCAQIWTGDALLRLFFTTCSALGPPRPLSQCKLSHV